MAVSELDRWIDYTTSYKTDRAVYVGWPNDGCPIEPDDDPMDFHGHGTHVAGIIAGRSKWYVLSRGVTLELLSSGFYKARSQ